MALKMKAREELSQHARLTVAATSAAILPNGDMIVCTATTIEKSTGGTWTTKKTIAGAEEARLCHRAVNGSLYVSFLDRAGTAMAAADAGLWRSTDDGENWTRVLALNVGECIWGFTENANGDLFAGVYQLNVANNANIYRSTDDGGTWTSVYGGGAFKHVHDVECDTATGYLYASMGDDYGAEQSLRSTNNGDTWGTILTGVSLQYTCGLAIPGVCRLFGTDEQFYGRIDRTTNDTTLTTVLSEHYFNVFAFRRNPNTGNVYAVCKLDPSATSPLYASIFCSTDDGLTWEAVATKSGLSAGDGFWFASEFVGDQMIVGWTVGGVFQNALLIVDT